MKKKLNANAIVLDLRRLTEETLSAVPRQEVSQ